MNLGQALEHESSATHALLSASDASRWINCRGAVRLSRDLPDGANIYAATGTVAHAVLNLALGPFALAPSSHLGQSHTVDGFLVTVDDDMVDRVDSALEYLQPVLAQADCVYLEHPVSYGDTIYADYLMQHAETRVRDTLAHDARGTADIIAGLGSELLVVDYKDGRVMVEADAPQLRLYAVGALEAMQGITGDYDTVRLVVVQPRVGPPREVVLTVEELMRWLSVTVVASAIAVIELESVNDLSVLGDYLTPGDAQCKWCRAKAICPALARTVAESMELPITQDTAALAKAMSMADLVEGWVTAVRAETERRLLAAVHVPGWKLVQGRKGARGWTSPDAAEALLRSMKLKVDEIYDLKLISPTTAEKRAKSGVIGPRQWGKVQALITQPAGKPSVAPESDPRPALSVAADAAIFANLDEELT